MDLDSVLSKRIYQLAFYNFIYIGMAIDVFLMATICHG